MATVRSKLQENNRDMDVIAEKVGKLKELATKEEDLSQSLREDIEKLSGQLEEAKSHSAEVDKTKQELHTWNGQISQAHQDIAKGGLEITQLKQ